MALTFGFYNSINHDRKYTAEQMGMIFDGIINDGIFGSIGEKFIVKHQTGMIITVGSGRAWFNHTWSYNDAPLLITIDEGELLLNRIDAVILEVNSSDDARENSIKVIKGRPATEATRPELQNDDYIHQYPLAYIDIPSGALEISDANITNMVGIEGGTDLVTGPLETINMDEVLGQWRGQINDFITLEKTDFDTQYQVLRAKLEQIIRETGTFEKMQQEEFETWFANIRYILDSDVAGHLQNEIDDINKYITATNGTKFDFEVQNGYAGYVMNGQFREFGSGGGGIVLEISYPPAIVGATIIAENGSERVEALATEDLKIRLDCKNPGTWVVRESRYGTSTVIETTYFGLYYGAVGGELVHLILTYEDKYIGSRIIVSNGDERYNYTATATKKIEVYSTLLGMWTIEVITATETFINTLNTTEYKDYEFKIGSAAVVTASVTLAPRMPDNYTVPAGYYKSDSVVGFQFQVYDDSTLLDTVTLDGNTATIDVNVIQHPTITIKASSQSGFKTPADQTINLIQGETIPVSLDWIEQYSTLQVTTTETELFDKEVTVSDSSVTLKANFDATGSDLTFILKSISTWNVVCGAASSSASVSTWFSTYNVSMVLKLDLLRQSWSIIQTSKTSVSKSFDGTTLTVGFTGHVNPSDDGYVNSIAFDASKYKKCTIRWKMHNPNYCHSGIFVAGKELIAARGYAYDRDWTTSEIDLSDVTGTKYVQFWGYPNAEWPGTAFWCTQCLLSN